MRMLASAAVLAALIVPAAPALADTGQCYDAYGRPVGGPFDTYRPNRRFINAVIARGGTCVVLGSSGYQGPSHPATGYGPYRPLNPYYRYDPSQDPGATHQDWCSTNPPSGYCIVPEMR